jgi:alpha-glucosidase
MVELIAFVMNNTLVRIAFIVLLFGLGSVSTVTGQTQILTSPDGRIEIHLSIDNRISWSLSLDNLVVIENANISMTMNNERRLGLSPKLKSTKTLSKEALIEPQIPHKDAKIISKFNELNLQFKGNFALIFRAYNDGVAYRFVDHSKKTTEVFSEELGLDFPEGSKSYFPQEASMYSHNERIYVHKALSEFKNGDFCSLPVLFESGSAKVLITEAALLDYPGMFLQFQDDHSLEGIHPQYVLKAVANENNSPDRNQILEQEAPYIAKVTGNRAYPWRVFMVANEDKTFVESNLLTELSEPTKIIDASWIKPGKVAWDWYNANNIYGVDFKAGINTDTYKYYIDFASENGIEYVILDEGWTKSTTEILEANSDLNLQELISYGKEKNVGIILWVLWKPLAENRDKILSLYSSWGAKGIKVDFMQRSDQTMVKSYEEIAETAAGYKLMVDYHGAFKPAGIEYVWPNLINYEGVKGNENNKWSSDISPEHNLTIPFIRMAAGPMDFTPGAMANAHLKNYAISFDRPMGLGTRCHQLAMYVVYEAPLQMLCDSPSRYKKEKESVDFITQIPTTWDETKVLEAAISDFVIVARRKGNTWYVGGMTDDTPRKFDIKLEFLELGDHQMEFFKDGMNASKYAEDYKREIIDVNRNSTIPIDMVSGGGWVAIIK